MCRDLELGAYARAWEGAKESGLMGRWAWAGVAWSYWYKSFPAVPACVFVLIACLVLVSKKVGSLSGCVHREGKVGLQLQQAPSCLPEAGSV